MRPEGAAEAERPGVSAVIATRNRREALEIVLDRLAELPVDEVLVVDNGSEDDTVERLSTREGNVRVLAQETNRGLAGRNLAVREARNELLLVLDDDAYPLPGAIETLIERFEQNARLAAGGGLVRDIDANGRVLRSTELGTFDWWLRAGTEGDAPPEGFPAFFFPEGAAMVRRSAYLEVGGYFEPYFHTVEGIDLTTRLLAAGWDVRYFPDARFDHMKAHGGRASDRALYLAFGTTSGTSGCTSPRGSRHRGRSATWRSTWWTLPTNGSRARGPAPCVTRGAAEKSCGTSGGRCPPTYVDARS